MGTADEGIKLGLRDSAIGLGQVIVDLIADPNLLAQAQAEFEHAGGAVSVAEVLSPDN